MDPLEPKNPRQTPPAPPRPEWLKPQPVPPAQPGVTPMMDFFQRRVDSLERELAVERERASAAQTLLSQQDALRAEVDAHLKGLTDQLRREKLERDGEEAMTHSRGRVEALEKRLDEMNSTFAQLLKDAVSQRNDSPSAGALAAELSAFRGALKDGMDGVARWRGELKEIAGLLPKFDALAERLPQEEKAFEESVGRRLEEFMARVARTLDDQRQAQDAARAQADARVEAVARERADLARAWESQSRALREEHFKDRVAREAELARQVGELASRLSELTASQQGAERGADGVREKLEQVLSVLTATPKAKDMVIAELEAEKAELVRLARDRQEALRRFAEERREVERSMGDGLLKLTGQLEDERAKTRAAEAESARRQGDVEALQARLAEAQRATAERDARLESAAAERDELARALMAEAEKVRKAREERTSSDAAADERAAELRRRLDEENARRAAAEGAAADARAQLGALAEQSARSLQERDATLARFAEWEKERGRLNEIIRKKDEMIALLSATFSGALKKQG